MISLTLPLCPSTNGLYVNTQHGRLKTAKYRQWRVEAGWTVKSQRPTKISDGPYTIDIAVPLGMPGDVDNRIKAGIDLLVSLGVLPDDKHMHKASVERDGSLPPNTMRITAEACA